jgi:hypothetical protein
MADAEGESKNTFGKTARDMPPKELLKTAAKAVAVNLEDTSTQTLGSVAAAAAAVDVEVDVDVDELQRNPCPRYYNSVNICRLRYDSAYPSASCVTQYNSPFVGSPSCRITRK